MKEWTQGFPQANALVEAEQFNDEYDAHKGTFNGGLDRTALNDDWCNRTHLKANALLLADVQSLTANDNFVSQPSGSSYDYFGCVQYSEYSGGWASTNISQTLSNCHEGMLHVELKGSFYINQHECRTETTQVKIRINLNGVRITGAGYFVQPFMSFRITADVPISSGTNEITVDWRMNGNNAYTSSEPIFHLFGVQLMSVARWR